MTRTVYSLVTAAAVALLLSACASGVDLKEQVPVETRTPTAGGPAASDAARAPAESQVATVQAGRTDGAALSDEAARAALAAAGRVVYFDFDSFVVRPDGRPVIESHAKVLTGNRAWRMVLEGHADERGGREYNLALGQKRALAVLNALTLLGVSPAQLEAVSYGEERPAVEGHDEAAWAKNRRVELKDAR